MCVFKSLLLAIAIKCVHMQLIVTECLEPSALERGAVSHCWVSTSVTCSEAVHKITQAPADIWGIEDRGTIKEGMIADVTIFDADSIARGDEYYVQDVPGDGYRYTRDAIGIKHVLVGGEVAYSQSKGYSGVARGQIV